MTESIVTDEQEPADPAAAIAREVNLTFGRVVVGPEAVQAMIDERPLDEPLEQAVSEATFAAMSKRGF